MQGFVYTAAMVNKGKCYCSLENDHCDIGDHRVFFQSDAPKAIGPGSENIEQDTKGKIRAHRKAHQDGQQIHDQGKMIELLRGLHRYGQTPDG